MAVSVNLIGSDKTLRDRLPNYRPHKTVSLKSRFNNLTHKKEITQKVSGMKRFRCYCSAKQFGTLKPLIFGHCSYFF